MNRTVYCLRLKLLFLRLYLSPRGPPLFINDPRESTAYAFFPLQFLVNFFRSFFFHGVLFRRFCDQYESSTSFLDNFLSMTYHLYPCKFVLSSQRLQYSKWTAGPFSSVTFRYIFMQFTCCDQPVQRFYQPENAID